MKFFSMSSNVICVSVAKPAQNIRVGLHPTTPLSCPLERIFIDFMGLLVSTKIGNQAIFVVMDSFSKFVAFYPVRSITSAVVCNVLEHKYFMNYGVPKSRVSDNVKVCKSELFYDFVSSGELRELIRRLTILRRLWRSETCVI
jgi:hypothetical protein